MNNEFPVKIGEDWVFFGDEHRDLTKKERESLRMEGSVRKLTETERDTLRDFELNGDVYEN